MTYSQEIFGTRGSDRIEARDAIVVGNDGNDVITSLGNVLAYGENGNDTVVAGVTGGKTEFVGAAGIDTLQVEAGTFELQAWGYPEGIVRIDVAGTGVPAIEAWGIEIVKFLDGSAMFNLQTAEGLTAAALYEAAFDRRPDSGGMEYWMTSAKPAQQMARDFIGSAEGQTAFGGLSNQDFVETLYQNVLDREGEAGGVQHWTSQLEAGALDRGDVLASFALSDENVALIGQMNPSGWLQNFAA
ncbi:DUF4214 domain-containing protein [Allorhizobium sp. NPDC080224]|uniref:DUF4214 domain-containing protein n=1 Tax=Allorhizobium sp. NPDC080224 TaxID=3390547 RepID=UPI003D071E23